MMGREGIFDPHEAVRRLEAISVTLLSRSEEWSGLSPVDALIERAKAKGRRYFTLRNKAADKPEAPSPESATAQAYRQKAKGE